MMGLDGQKRKFGHIFRSRTHVGGTIAGNGDASGGRRLGTAKGAQLVALGTGDGVSIFAAEQGLEWVYEHSRPGNNPNNIRVVSNSWGTDGDYNPQGAIATITDALTFENGVAVIFAASNSGGSGAEDDSDLEHVYANTLPAISIAALTHDGTAVLHSAARMDESATSWPDLALQVVIFGQLPLEELQLMPRQEPVILYYVN